MSLPAVLFKIAEGWTADLDAQLLLDGAAFDGTGMTVGSVVRDKEGTIVTVTTSWGTQASAIARLSPTSNVFLAAKSPYRISYQVTDGNGKIAYFPAEDAMTIMVRLP